MEITLPDPAIIPQAKQPLFTRYDITEYKYISENCLSYIIADTTLDKNLIHRIFKIARRDVIGLIEQNNEFFYQGKKIFIERIDGGKFLHTEISDQRKDIL